MASARGTSKGLGGMQPRKVMESDRRKKGWFCPVSAGTGSSSLSCSVEPKRNTKADENMRHDHSTALGSSSRVPGRLLKGKSLTLVKPCNSQT